MFELWVATWCLASYLLPTGGCISNDVSVYKSSQSAVYEMSIQQLTKEFWLYKVHASSDVWHCSISDFPEVKIQKEK